MTLLAIRVIGFSFSWWPYCFNELSNVNHQQCCFTCQMFTKVICSCMLVC